MNMERRQRLLEWRSPGINTLSQDCKEVVPPVRQSKVYLPSDGTELQ